MIDPLPVVRIGIGALLAADPRFTIAWQVATPHEALPKVESDPPDLILSEAVFPGYESVLDLIDCLRSRSLQPPLLAYSTFDERLLASRVLHRGGRGYLMKTGTVEELIEAIQTVLDGKVYLSRQMTEIALGSLGPGKSAEIRHDSLPGLTNRELEVLQLIGEGMKTRDIAGVLHISAKTIDTHRSRIREKLGLGPDIGLIAFASQWMTLKQLEATGSPVRPRRWCLIHNNHGLLSIVGISSYP